ncbi:MAG: DMT family transporter, partial [Pseudomonadota bacterium]|nr:DMT family transporter [Pseudomonadota bacterium]
MKTSSLINWFYLSLLVIFWGSTFALTKYALDDFSPLWIVSLRLSIGFVIIYSILKLRGETLPTGIVNWAWLALIGMTAFFPFFLICWGTQYLDTNIGGILFGIGPLFTVLAAHFLVPNEKLNRLKLFGVIIGFAGLYILLFE